jgi:hypothetical protein
MSDPRGGVEGPPDNNAGKYRIPGESPEPIAEEPMFTSNALEAFKEMRMEVNRILSQNRASFKEIHDLSPGGSVSNPEVLAVLMMLARRLTNADTELRLVNADKK